MPTISPTVSRVHHHVNIDVYKELCCFVAREFPTYVQLENVDAEPYFDEIRRQLDALDPYSRRRSVIASQSRLANGYPNNNNNNNKMEYKYSSVKMCMKGAMRENVLGVLGQRPIHNVGRDLGDHAREGVFKEKDNPGRNSRTRMEEANMNNNFTRRNISYAQVVRLSKPQKRFVGGRVEKTEEDDPDWKGMRVNLDPSEWEWLKGCFVGKLREADMAEEIQTATEREGIQTTNQEDEGTCMGKEKDGGTLCKIIESDGGNVNEEPNQMILVSTRMGAPNEYENSKGSIGLIGLSKSKEAYENIEEGSLFVGPNELLAEKNSMAHEEANSVHLEDLCGQEGNVAPNEQVNSKGSLIVGPNELIAGKISMAHEETNSVPIEESCGQEGTGTLNNANSTEIPEKENEKSKVETEQTNSKDGAPQTRRALEDRHGKKKIFCRTKKLKKGKKKQLEMLAWKDFWIDLRINEEQKGDDVIRRTSQLEGKNRMRSTLRDSSHILSCPDEKKYKFEEAAALWNIGKQIGVIGNGNEAEVIARLADLETRDKEEQRRRSKIQSNDR
ncbi:hypothetical protein RIF29_16215 [Crotalaria pallida]|uniref:Uncharacterized protein n=1 Tax=Crotalaria pallida TaxID=3830 RepID=A0AAN9IBU5_CROPI